MILNWVILLVSIDIVTSVKAQVRDLRYNSRNLYSNYIIRHMLIE